jgi:uncharacterized protein (TIGR03437 family)
MKLISSSLALRCALLTALLLAALTACLNLLADCAPWLSASAQQPAIVVVNAASFANNGTLAPETIASVFGAFKTQNDQPFAASALPLPITLGGIQVTVKGVHAPLFFASNTQINFLIPNSTAIGPASVAVTSADNTTRTGTIMVAPATPGLFTARSDGQGTAVAQTTTDGVNYLNIFNPDGSEREVDAGTRTRPNFLILYATGVRHAASANPSDGNGVAEAVTITIQGVPAITTFAGAQPGFDGLDQINLIIPPELSGFGTLRLQVSVNGQAANPVTLKLGGQRMPVNSQILAFGQTISGTLAAEDQVQDLNDESGRTYFYDAYRFNAAANTTLAIDLRSAQFDANLILYRAGSDGALSFIASDDQTGGLGDGRLENNNALLLAVLPEAGDYVVFATSSDLEPNGVGSYTLALKADVIQPVTYGATVTSDDFAASSVQTSAGAFLKAYWLAGTQGEGVEISADSSVFDPFLILNLNHGGSIGFDDNSGGGSNGLGALINKALPETTRYIIIVTPLESNRSGNFSLSVKRIGS